MRILITNDDGIHEPGLGAMARELTEWGHEVSVVGPSGQRSGSAASLGTVSRDALVDVRTVTIQGLEGIAALAIDGPPALAVRAACTGAFGPAPDLVVSGVNPGFNAGRLLLHSGTVGAAMTAAALDVCGIAVSTSDTASRGFAAAAVVTSWVVNSMRDAGLPPVALNVNVPDLAADELAGVEQGGIGRDSITVVGFDRVERGLQVRRSTHGPPFAPGTDSDLLSRGVVSITCVPLPWMGAWDPTEVLDNVRSQLRSCVVG